ncbi:V4R domain-containing protein [Candidatus Aenigmatarchaeota archaeon]
MLSGFLKKLLLSRQASLIEGEIKLLGHPFYLQPLSELIFLHYDMKKKFGKKGVEVLYDSGKKSSKDFFNKIQRFTVKKSDKIKLFINLLNLYGFGEINVISHVNNKKATLEVGNNVFAKNYAAKYGKQKDPVDHLLAGLLSGFFEELWKKKTTGKEIICIASSKTKCRFDVTV